MCNRGCTDNLMSQKQVRCVLNAGMGGEQPPDLKPVATPRRIVVVGGGPAEWKLPELQPLAGIRSR